MTLIHVVIDGIQTLESFSPVEVISYLGKLYKEQGPQPTDIYFSEVK